MESSNGRRPDSLSTDSLSPDSLFPDASDDDADSYDPWSDPVAIGQMLGMPPPPSMSAGEVRREASLRVARIFDLHDRLRAIVHRHEPTIQKRWLKKKNKQQRLDVLAAAWGPGMPPGHRPDFDFIRRQSGRSGLGFTRGRECFLLPHINQEDLAKPKTLLLLLNARARHHPSEFAGADFHAMRLGIVSLNIQPVFLNGHVMILFVGPSDRSNYGKLLSWDDDPDAFDWLHTQKQSQPGEGLLVLEAQERTLDFLVKCCERLLHDMPAESIASDAFPAVPEPQLKTERETDGFDSLAVMAEEAPYRVPAQLDLVRIESMLQAKVSAAQDHIWAMREDPSYFADLLSDYAEHRQEMIKDSLGQMHPSLRPAKKGLFWARVIGNVVVNAYLELEMFSELHRQIKELQTIHAKYASQLSPAADLPEELLAALLKFRHHVNQAAKGPVGLLKESVPASPPWRRFYHRQPPFDPKTTIMRLHPKPGAKMNKVEGHLSWLLTTLWEDGKPLFLMSMPLALDELERLLQSEPEAKELITAYVAQVIGGLSIIGQCMAQIDLFQPWSRTFEHHLVDREAGIKDDYAKCSASWAKLLAALRDRNLGRAATLGDPTDNKFAYPSEKRRTRENTAALRRAESNLDKLWANLDHVIHSGCGSLEGTAVGRLLSQQRGLRRTPEWIDAPEAANKGRGAQQQQQQQQQQRAMADSEPIYKPLSTLYFDLPGKRQDGSSQLRAAPQAKVKSKTRGSAADEAADSLESLQIAPEGAREADRVKISVDARALKVFRTLFFDPTVTSSPGEVSWNDFIYAMTYSGLFAAEKLYGSVWQFDKVDGPDLGRIQFHEPHPRGKIPFVMARRYGRRLRRNFGWDSDTFVLQAK